MYNDIDVDIAGKGIAYTMQHVLLSRDRLYTSSLSGPTRSFFS